MKWSGEPKKTKPWSGLYGREEDHGTTFDPGGDKVVRLEKDRSTLSVISIERDNFDDHFCNLHETLKLMMHLGGYL